MADENLLHGCRLLKQRGRIRNRRLIRQYESRHQLRQHCDVRRQFAGGMRFLVWFPPELVLGNALQEFPGGLALVFEFTKHGLCDGHHLLL
jgi:hypothetical protein